MSATIPENGLEDKLSHQIEMGLLQEVIPPRLIEELLDTDQLWEEREQKTKMVTITSWLIALPLYPSLSQRRVYGKMVSGLRTTRDDGAEALPVRAAFSYRRSQLGSELMQELACPVCGAQSHCPDSGSLLERPAEAFHRWDGLLGRGHGEPSSSLSLQQR